MSILYAAVDGLTTFAEAFQDQRVVDRTARDPWFVGFETTRDVELLDLAGLWPTQAGASMNINSGPRPRAQRWSRCIHAAYPAVEGLYYASSMNANQPAIALYERAMSALPAAPAFNRALLDPILLAGLRNAAHQLGYGLI